MGKIKNLEKKLTKPVEFDKNNPENRKKSINDAKLKKKLKAKDKTEEAGKVSKIRKNKNRNNKAKKEKILQQIKKEVEENHKKPENEIPDDKLVKREIVKKAIIALKDGIQKEVDGSDKKNLFDDELRLGLQIIAAKIPQCPNHVRKILLTHSLYDQQPDICFIIKDQIPKKADQDENVRNFEEKLKNAGISGVKTIIPISKLKQDYLSHSLKLKLCNTYDVFLVESEIAEHVYTFLGKHFILKRKRPLQIDTKKENVLKISIENAIKKVSFKLSSSSNLSCFEVGTVKMDNVNIADNVMASIDQLKEKWPGSWKNISRLYLKPMRPSKVTIPIYYSNINPNDVEVPVIQGAKQNRLDKLAEELKKKSKKLKLDMKKKRLVKNSAAPNKIGKDAKVINKKGGNKKESKVDAKSEIKIKDETEIKVEPSKKSKRKEIVKDIVTEQQPQSIEPAAKTKKNKNKSTDDQPSKDSKKHKKAPEVVEPEPVKKKKKNKHDVNLEAPIESTETDVKPALEKKKKNKNKSKADLVDTNNDYTAEIVAEKEQISIKKKKKDKKNKA